MSDTNSEHGDEPRRISNGDSSKREQAPLPMLKVLDGIYRSTEGWPRRVEGALFVHRGKRICWLETPPALFGWLASETGPVAWHRGIGYVTKEEAFAELRRTTRNYHAVESLPHWPAIVGHYYASGKVEPGNGESLRTLLERFKPATKIDGALLLAALVTPFWGGPGGARPMFFLTSDHGRGVGKTSFVKMVGRVVGGLLDFAANEDASQIKARLLSPDGAEKRIALLDNVKSLKYSSPEIEALVTSPVISGRRLYVGEGSRPNTLTWYCTLNGASLSTDIAQRAVMINLAPPDRTGGWEDETAAFIEKNRDTITADVAAFYGREARALTKYSRWAGWERDVLARLPDPDECQRVILERQGSADVETDEADIIGDYFGQRLSDYGYTIEADRVHIPTSIAMGWFNAATGEKRNAASVTRIVGQLHGERKLTCLSVNPSRTYGRGLLWTGERWDELDDARYDLPDRIERRDRYNAY